MPYVISLLFLLLSACAPQSDGPTDYGPDYLPVGTVSAQLAPYLQAFKTRYSADIKFTVAFDPSSETGGDNESGGTTVGVCRVFSNGVREVLVNKTFWDNTGSGALAEAKKTVLIFHELGHCHFDREHDSRMFSGTKKPLGQYDMPYSMMYPLLNPTLEFWSTHSDYFYNELAETSGNVYISSNTQPPANAAGYVDDKSLTVVEHHSLESGDCEEVIRSYPKP